MLNYQELTVFSSTNPHVHSAVSGRTCCPCRSPLNKLVSAFKSELKFLSQMQGLFLIPMKLCVDLHKMLGLSSETCGLIQRI